MSVADRGRPTAGSGEERDASVGTEQHVGGAPAVEEAHDPPARLANAEVSDRRLNYSLYAYAAEKPHGARYTKDDAAPD